MSLFTTKKSVMANYGLVISVPYDELQFLLSFSRKNAHTEGVYGWNADIYDMEAIGYPGVAIVTGYRPFGNYYPGREIYRAFDDKAKAILYNDSKDSADYRREELKNLLLEFVELILENRYTRP